MSTIDEILRALTAAIRAELLPEIRAEVRAEVNAAIDRGGKSKPTTKKAPKKAPVKAATPDTAALKVKAGVRRSQEDIEQAARVVSIWFKANPGSRVDQAAAALKVPVKDLQRPVAWLLAQKKLTKKGKLRGTQYTVRA